MFDSQQYHVKWNRGRSDLCSQTITGVISFIQFFSFFYKTLRPLLLSLFLVCAVLNSSLSLLPLLQCSNGHTLCSGCKPRVHNRCPTCRHELGNIRCLALEKVAASLELPCKYQSFGCIGIIPYYSKLKHESECSFRPYNCPYAGSECTVIGDIPYLVAHLKDDHKVDMHVGSTFNHRYVKANPHEVENATWMLTVSTVALLPFTADQLLV